jgi:hypothetical protein
MTRELVFNSPPDPNIGDVLVSNADASHRLPLALDDSDTYEASGSLLFNYSGSEEARLLATAVNRRISNQSDIHSYDRASGDAGAHSLRDSWKAGNPKDSEYSPGELEVLSADEFLRRTFVETDRERQRRLGLDQPPRCKRSAAAEETEELYERIEDSDEEAEDSDYEEPLESPSPIQAAIGDARLRDAFRTDSQSSRSSERFPAAGSH